MAERVGVGVRGGEGEGQGERKKEHILKAGKVAYIPSAFLILYKFLLGV